MKRFASICFILLLAVLFMAQSNDAVAQTIKIKRMGRSLNELPKGSPWHITNGLRAVGKGSKVYFEVDTLHTGVTGTPAWTLGTLPPGSTATLDSASTLITSFTADTTGFFYVSVSMGGQSATDTIYASTYTGVGTDASAGCFCHFDKAPGFKSTWQNTGHAKIFREGVSGELEVIAEIGSGVYAKSCAQCHTTGFDATLNNNNFGYLAHTLPAPAPASFDSTWFMGLAMTSDGRDFIIKTGTDSIWAKVPEAAKPLGTIGCESCHGPSAGHKTYANGQTTQLTNQLTIGKSFDQAVCNQCHNASGKHSLGKYFNMSVHAESPNGSHTHQAGCAPCHVGGLFARYAANKDTTGFGAGVAAAPSAITCAVCHDPHGTADLATNPDFLRTQSIGTLKNGYVVPAGLGGAGQICGNCHMARYDVRVRVTDKAPYYGFVNRFGPHNAPQADMLYGTSGYQYGDTTLTGLNTHANLPDGCVTCHMQDRGGLANHQFSMSPTDTIGGFNPTTVCKNCHGDINTFDDVRAPYDYDGNGRIEGVQTEVQGLLNRLKARLPQDVNGEPVTMTVDSLKVKNHPEYVQGIWNYYMVKNDKSRGVHNAKYAVALLQKALGTYPLDVKPVGGEVPAQFALNQNYPNPFNPSTQISFSVADRQSVKLEVYDILGNLVKTLVDQEMGAGNYSVTWNGVDKNGTRVASGMYLYKLQAGSFTSVKKMLLVK